MAQKCNQTSRWGVGYRDGLRLHRGHSAGHGQGVARCPSALVRTRGLYGGREASLAFVQGRTGGIEFRGLKALGNLLSPEGLGALNRVRVGDALNALPGVREGPGDGRDGRRLVFNGCQDLQARRALSGGPYLA